MLHLRAKAIRWVADDPFPGLVEVSMTDAHGTDWRFVDKAPVFSVDALTAETTYPVDVIIACAEVQGATDPDGHELVVVSTATPWGLQTSDGWTRFEVSRTQLVSP
jgi:hypothetical protein